jgi:hypothetical protein
MHQWKTHTTIKYMWYRGEEDDGSYGDDDGGLAKKVRIGQCGCCGWDGQAKRRKGAIVDGMAQHRWEMGA